MRYDDEQPTNELAINMKTTKVLGRTIAPATLVHMTR